MTAALLPARLEVERFRESVIGGTWTRV